jgi:hypothetical protein
MFLSGPFSASSHLPGLGGVFIVVRFIQVGKN